MGIAYADYDRDGFVDFVVGNFDVGFVLYRNAGLAGAGNHWLTVRHEGALARVSEEPPRRQTGPRQPRGVAGITRGPVSSSTAPTSAVSRARKQSGG